MSAQSFAPTSNKTTQSQSLEVKSQPSTQSSISGEVAPNAEDFLNPDSFSELGSSAAQTSFMMGSPADRQQGLSEKSSGFGDAKTSPSTPPSRQNKSEGQMFENLEKLQRTEQIVEEMKELQEVLIKKGGDNPKDIHNPNTTLGKWGVLSQELEQLTGHKVTPTHISEIREMTGSANPSNSQIRKILNDKLHIAVEAGHDKIFENKPTIPPIPPAHDRPKPPPKPEMPVEPPPTAPKETKQKEAEKPQEKEQPVEAPVKEETEIDRQVEKDLQELTELQKKSRTELLSELTPENIEKRRADGSLIVLALAIDSKDQSNYTSPEEHESALRNFREDADRLQKKIDEAKGISTDQKRDAINNGEYASFFDQPDEFGARQSVDRSNLSDAQIDKLYEACVLEKHMRTKGENGISYSAHSALVDTLKENSSGDCDTVGLYADCLVSAVDSPNLKTTITTVDFHGHAQMLIDLGDDVTISKNTSNMQFDKDDPYDQNFYDSKYDMKNQARNPDKLESQTRHANAGILLARLAGGSNAYNLENTDSMTQEDREFRERISKMEDVCDSTLVNHIHVIGSQYEEGSLSAEELIAQRKPLIKELLKRGCNDSSIIHVTNFCRFARKHLGTEGEAHAQEIIGDLEQAMGPHNERLSNHVGQLIHNMRNRPDFDKRNTTGDNSLSVDIENTADRLWDLATKPELSSTPEQRRYYRDMAVKLHKEIASWKYETPKGSKIAKANLRKLEKLVI